MLIAGVAIALSGLLLAAVVAGVDFRLPATLVAVSVAAGICAGLFDYTGAIARAEMKDRAYAGLIIVKNVLALILMVGGAWVTGDAAVVLAGSGLSVVGALLAMRRGMDRQGPRLAALRIGHVKRFAAYSLPLVGANVMMAAIPLMNRSLLASQHGLAEAGYFALASDMGIKLFGTLGATMEILLLRAVVRTDESEGREAALKRIAANQVVVLLIAAPAALGLFCVLPPFERLFVPGAYHGHFAGYFAVMLPAFVALTVTQAAFNPVFMIAGRTWPAIVAAGAGLAVNIGLLLVATRAEAPLWFGAALGAGFVTILAVTAIWSLASTPERPPARDLAWLLVALARDGGGDLAAARRRALARAAGHAGAGRGRLRRDRARGRRRRLQGRRSWVIFGRVGPVDLSRSGRRPSCAVLPPSRCSPLAPASRHPRRPARRRPPRWWGAGGSPPISARARPSW